MRHSFAMQLKKGSLRSQEVKSSEQRSVMNNQFLKTKKVR
ncbi:hypothetical protein HOLDEFILI_03722 [Holdemania filiformis DSM 12042]|uniref:Uncharacterized protein n=1 Tax=Holdemania filiformis DSM 12042 TaxID=545696 RepID=B9YD09_9FIRM|nr:hypothetical protein HOLDEFILI_03722 [Holdemania filiformis DSM 12042]